ncbi:MAG: hypothetical protein KC486_22845 [Myxococcales bacterium]|nr:hypothetical protein [Myxococcales bacterium]
MAALALALLGGCVERPEAATGDSDSGATEGTETAGSTSVGDSADGFGQLTTACGEGEGDGVGPTDWRPTEGCPTAWPYSEIRAPGPSGHRDHRTAVFGYKTIFTEDGERYAGPELGFFATSVDESVPYLRVYELGGDAPKDWLGEYVAQVHYHPGDTYVSGYGYSIGAIVEICSYAGNWQAYDPEDPPRLLGQIRSVDADESIHGTFDAVFCADYYSEFACD